MPAHRDVAAFDARARTYENGWLGRFHHEVSARAADLALATSPDALRVLDVGCGTGYLLGLLADRCPSAAQLVGIDPATAMLGVAIELANDDRIRFLVANGEQLPFQSGAFDLVVASTSFDHWIDQQLGLEECARVTRSGGHLILVDQFSWIFTPTLLGARRTKARTKRRCEQLLGVAGFDHLNWHAVYAGLINAVVATRR
jgi:ubiquinone/menaquinone biosynthesis C-methylase UbiE